MNKGLIQLGIGLLFSLTGLIGEGGFVIPRELQLIGGLGLMLYGSYQILIDLEKSTALKYIIAAWSVFLFVG